MGSSGPAFLTTLISGIGTFLAFAMEVALLVVALTVVRGKRPDAVLPLVVGAVLFLIPTVLWPIFTAVLPLVASGSGGGLGVFYSVFSLFSTVLRTGGWAALLFAIVKLAGPPGGGPPRDPTRY